jgi:hypothetical protein
LGTMRLTENLRAQIATKSNLEIIGDAEELDFDGDGNLAGLLEPTAVGH